MNEQERQEWNRAVENGDDLSGLKDRILTAIHTKIMDEDSRYHEAGWTAR